MMNLQPGKLLWKKDFKNTTLHKKGGLKGGLSVDYIAPEFKDGLTHMCDPLLLK